VGNLAMGAAHPGTLDIPWRQMTHSIDISETDKARSRAVGLPQIL
jgi:hypothetical protein